MSSPPVVLTHRAGPGILDGMEPGDVCVDCEAPATGDRLDGVLVGHRGIGEPDEPHAVTESVCPAHGGA